MELLAFIYSMVTAFSECVSREAEWETLSPPFPRVYYTNVKDEIKHIAA